MIYDLLGDLCSHALGLLVQRGISLVNSAALVTVSRLSDLSEFLSPLIVCTGCTCMCCVSVCVCVCACVYISLAPA